MPGQLVQESRGEGIGKPNEDGVNVSEHLSIVAFREGRFLKNSEGQGQNRTREIRLSGIEGGLVETWVMGAGLRAMGKSMGDPPDPKAARATSLPDLTGGQVGACVSLVRIGKVRSRSR